MKFLITGGAGLVGNMASKKLLEAGHEIFSVDNFILGTQKHIQEFESSKNFTFEKWDVSKPDWYAPLKGKSFDVVLHLAANSDISLGHKNPAMEFSRTLDTTFHTLMAAKELGIPKFLFSSTSAVYGANPEFPTPEKTAPMHPVSHYGAAKLASEAFISSFVENYGLKAWVFRFGNVVGEKLTHGVIYDFTQRLKSNPKELTVLGNGQQTKTYIHVKDCVDGILHAFEKSKAGTSHAERLQIFNLSTEGNTSVRQIAEKSVSVISKEKAKTQIHYGSSSVGWVGDVARTQLDVKKIMALGWKPKMDSSTAVYKSIEDHYAWTQQN